MSLPYESMISQGSLPIDKLLNEFFIYLKVHKVILG